MLRAALTLTLLVAGCEEMSPADDMFAPVPAQRAAGVPGSAAPPPAATPADGGGFDFEGEDRDEAEGGVGEEDPVALQAKMVGLPPEDVERLRGEPAPAPAPARPDAPASAPPAPAAAAAPAWDPTKPLADSSWGVRVLATLLDVQPPRAVLGLPDGTEEVVQPGSFLPDHRLVVLAIGRDAVQIAQVTPQGFYAKVDTQTVRALFPGDRGSP